MVYIPWNQMGICRHWMLQRCFSGNNCKWRHPEPRERQWLWDYHTAKQLEDKQRGILPPENPWKRLPEPTRTGTVTNAGGQDAPPPTSFLPPAPPSSSYEGVYGAPPGIHGANETRHPATSAPGVAQSHLPFSSKLDPTAPVWRSPGTHNDALDDVSMLDAPPSPKNDRGDAAPLSTQANAAPLGRPNRLAHVQGKEGAASELQQPRSAQFSGFEPHDTTLRPAQAFNSGFSPDVPSPAAVSLWKRGDQSMTDDIRRMDITEPRPRTGSYWDRMRQQKASGGVQRKVEIHPSSVKMSEFTRNTNSWDGSSSQVTQHMQTPDIPASSPAPSLGTTPPATMGATKRLSNGETKHVGPHPSTIRVSAPYISQAAITKKLQQATSSQTLDPQERSIAEAREDTIRLQGVGWIDNVRRSLQLPIRTYTTACIYFHKFRLAYAGGVNGVDYSNAWPDACAATLLTACKVEDTLKKSRDILAAAYNFKANSHDQLGADDAVFEGPSRVVIGLERLVLEAGGFDFRSRNPHKLLLKVAKSLKGEDGVLEEEKRKEVGTIGWSVLTDLYRTFAPLKQTSVTMAFASLELAAHLIASTSNTDNTPSPILSAIQQLDYQKWSTSREEIMETLLDLLDLYTQHTSQTVLGPKYSLDDFLRIRLAFNKECNESNIPRYTTAPPSDRNTGGTNGSTLRVSNGHPTPVSPMEPGPQPPPQADASKSNVAQTAPEGGGTLRFMLNPELAADEKAQVQKYFIEEWEEYEEEIEIPQPCQQSRDREPNRDRERERDRSQRDRERTPRDALPPLRSDRGDRDLGRGRDERDRERDRVRDRVRDREREAERERARARDAERDRRYGADRRFDERKDRRYDDRRYEDDRRQSHGRR